MSLLDDLKKQAEGLLNAQGGDGPNVPPALVDSVYTMIKTQGLSAIVDRFEKAGLGTVVDSWVGTGANLPISPEEVRTGLGGESLEPLADDLKLPVEHLSGLLSNLLPGLVDKLTPGGVIDDQQTY